jgi:hypothetical protein
MTRHRLHVWPWLRRPGSLLLRDWLAITIGSRIFAWRPMNAAELDHELAHVRQWDRHGWYFPFAYLAAALRARRAGKRWYRDNRFEQEARDAARRVGEALQPGR